MSTTIAIILGWMGGGMMIAWGDSPNKLRFLGLESGGPA